MATNESYETYEYDVLVIGAGGAGLRAIVAPRLAPRARFSDLAALLAGNGRRARGTGVEGSWRSNSGEAPC